MARLSLQPAQGYISNQREDVALEGGEVDERLLLLTPEPMVNPGGTGTESPLAREKVENVT